MNPPAQGSSLGCLHRSLASVSHTRSAAHFHRRPAKSLRIQAVIETETQSPATSNGSAARVRLSSCICAVKCIGVAVDTLAITILGMQAGVPPGTPTVDTLVRPSPSSHPCICIFAPLSCTYNLHTCILVCVAGPALKAKEESAQSHHTSCIFRNSLVPC